MLLILHTAVPICHCCGNLWKREVQRLWRIRLTPKWMVPRRFFLRFLPDFYNIQKVNWAAVKKSWNFFFIAKMYHSVLPVLRLGAAEAGQQSVCLEYWYTSKVSKTMSRRNLQMNKTKAQHHSPPVGISLFALLGHLTYKGTHLTRGDKISSQFSKELLQVILVSQGDDFSST